MWDLIGAGVSAFGVIFVAELGDKTQLVALGFGAQYRLRTVALGLVLGYAFAGGIAAIVGGALGAALPERPLTIVSGLVFLLFAAFALRPEEDDDDDLDDLDDGNRAVRRRSGRAVIASIAVAIALAEMGDKTQLATVALAARSNPVAVWIGATAGEVLAASLGAVAGRQLGSRLDPRLLRKLSAALFAVFGVALLVAAL